MSAIYIHLYSLYVFRCTLMVEDFHGLARSHPWERRRPLELGPDLSTEDVSNCGFPSCLQSEAQNRLMMFNVRYFW